MAGRRGELGEAIERLPPLLDELEPTADRLAALASDATPTLRDLRRAAPGARGAARGLRPASPTRRGRRSKRLAETSRGRAPRRARGAARGRQAASRWRRSCRRSSSSRAELQESVRDTGVVEGLQLYAFYGAGAQARFDQFSHILPSYQIAGTCQQYAREPAPECDAHFDGEPRRATRRAAQPSTTCSASEPRSQNSLAGSPVLVGAATVLVRGRRRLPLLQREQRAAVRPHLRRDRPGAGRRRARARQRGADRRQARRRGRGDRRGGAARATTRSSELDARCSTTLEPLPDDSVVTVRPRSPLGLKYLELKPGTSRGGRSRRTTSCRSSAAQPIVELDEVVNAFDSSSRRALRQVLDGLGPGFAGPRRRLERAAGRRPGAAPRRRARAAQPERARARGCAACSSRRTA